MGKKKENIGKLKTEFLPEALEIVEKPAAPLGNIIIYLVFFVMVSFFVWACVGKVDEVAMARGRIMSVEGVQEVQAVGNGVVTKVNVKEGDTVQKGDILYSMDKELDKLNIQYSEGNAGLIELKLELLDQLLNGKDIKDYRQKEYSREQLDVINYMITLSESNDYSLAEYETAVANARNQYELAKNGLSSISDKEEYLNTQKNIAEETKSMEKPAQIELELLESNYEYLKAEEKKYKKLYEAGAKSKAEWEKKVRECDNAKKQIEVKRLEVKMSLYRNQEIIFLLNMKSIRTEPIMRIKSWRCLSRKVIMMPHCLIWRMQKHRGIISCWS